MATKTRASSNQVDEDYIDMEISSSSSSSNFLCCSTSINSPPSQSRDFEFQMCSVSHDGESTTSPADELFYKGKLLPLHLPPRLQMVQKLIQNSNDSTFDTKTEEPFEETCVTSFTAASTAPSTDTSSTPLESCNISPSESRRISSDRLNLDEYFFEWSIELGGFIGDDSKKLSWTKKLNKIKQCSLTQKLKASREYLKSLFNKSGCSNESCAKADASKVKDCLNKYMKVSKRSPFVNGRSNKTPSTSHIIIDRELVVEDGNIGVDNNQRRSFSGAIQRHCAKKSSSSLSSSVSSSGSSSSSSSFSFSSSSGFHDLQSLKRSISASSEIENSIEGAIAHCKQSQQPFS